MRKWSVLLMIALVALLIPASAGTANAQGELTVIKSADKDSAAPGENVTYTYIVTNIGTVTVYNVTLTDDKLGQLTSGVTLAPGESVTTTTVYEVKPGDFWRLKPITNIATITATGPDGEQISAKSQPVSVVPSRVGMLKALILKLSGVPGKGIDKAPGLQKPFNPISQAAEHAGKKEKPETPEELRIRERAENQGAEAQLQIQSKVKNQAGTGQVVQGEAKAVTERIRLKKNWAADNQTQEHPSIQVDNQDKPAKGKPHKNPKAGNQP